MANAMPHPIERQDLVHFAGRHRLSPALRDGAPALIAPGAPGERCGWPPFFAALAARRLAAVLEPDEPASFRLVPAGAAARPAGPPAGLRARGAGAFAEARRFLAALRGRYPPA